MDPSPSDEHDRPDRTLRDLAAASLDRLWELAPFDVWMLTEVVGGRQVVLVSRGPGDGPVSPDGTRWTDTFCLRMVSGQGPRVAGDAQAVPAYRAAQKWHAFPIGAYAGHPLLTAEGRLFGTLCAVHPTALMLPEMTVEREMRREAGVLGDQLAGLRARPHGRSPAPRAILVIEVPGVQSTTAAAVLAPMTPADVRMSTPTPHRIELAVPESYSFELLSLTDAIERQLTAHRIQGFFGFGVNRPSLDDARHDAIAMASNH